MLCCHPPLIFEIVIKMENNTDVEMNGSVTNNFDNLVILREIGNIVHVVSNEDFLDIVPKAKLGRMKWLLTFNCLKQGIYDEMVQDLSAMWEFENMPDKLNQLDIQKEIFSSVNEDQILWRPQLNSVKSQLKAHDVANLKKQKASLESLAKEYEVRVNRLKNMLSAKRGYIKALQLDIQKYQKKNEELISKISNKLEGHEHISRLINPDNMEFNSEDKLEI